MRVMLYADTYPPQVNGVASSVCTIAHALSQAGHAVMVCAAGGCRAGDDVRGPFPVVRIPALPLPFYADFTLAPPVGRGFARLVRDFDPDIIHCHSPLGVGWRGARAALASDIPLVGTHHTLFGDYVPSYLRLGHEVNAYLAALLRRYIAAFYNQCDVVTCASRYLARDLVSSGMTRPVTIVPNALDTDRFRPLPGAARRDIPGRRIITFGRLAPEKNLPRLVRLVEPVLRRRPDVRFEIVGDGPMRSTLAAQVRALGLERQVHFAGWLHGEALVERIASSEVCVSASMTENQPMALLESLACGVPVVALAAAGVPEIIVDGDNGFLVLPDAAPEAFTTRIELMLADGDLRRRMSGRARESAQAYSQAVCLRMSLASYQQAIALSAVRRARNLWPGRGPMGEPRLARRRVAGIIRDA